MEYWLSPKGACRKRIAQPLIRDGRCSLPGVEHYHRIRRPNIIKLFSSAKIRVGIYSLGVCCCWDYAVGDNAPDRSWCRLSACFRSSFVPYDDARPDFVDHCSPIVGQLRLQRQAGAHGYELICNQVVLPMFDTVEFLKKTSVSP